MPSRFDPQPPHVINLTKRMTQGNMSQVENAKQDEGVNLKGERVALPWSTGKPLRSGGMDPRLGVPKGPEIVIPAVAGEALHRELSRAVTLDKAGEGVLDVAEALGCDLLVEEQQFEAEEAAQPAPPEWPPAADKETI